MINCQAWEQQLLKSLPWGSSRNPTWTRCQFSESTSSKPKNSQRATDPSQKNCGRATHPRSRFQGSGLKVLGSWSHAISSASYLPTHTTQAIWSKAMLPKGNLVGTTFKAMSKCSVPLFKGEHSLFSSTQSMEHYTHSEMAFMWSYHCLIHPTSYLNRQKPLSRQFVVDSNGNCAYCGLDQNFSPLGYVSV